MLINISTKLPPGMSSSVLASQQPGSSKQQPFDDSCFKTPLPVVRKSRRGRGGTTTNVGTTRHNGHYGQGASRGGRGGARSRIIAPVAPQPPPLKFELHDMMCPHSSTFLGALNLPKLATEQPSRLKSCKVEKWDTSSCIVEKNPHCALQTTVSEMKPVKTEMVENTPGTSKFDTEENGQIKVRLFIHLRFLHFRITCVTPNFGFFADKNSLLYYKTGLPRLSILTLQAEIGFECSVGADSSEDKVIRRTQEETDKASEDNSIGLPFVDEIVIDEFSLLLFTCPQDEQVFNRELAVVRAREEAEKKRLAAEKSARIEKLKKRIRAKKRVIEKANRIQRKRARSQKRDRTRSERKSRHDTLKQVVRDVKARGTVDKALKKQWKVLREKAKRKLDHEARKDARRAKKEKKKSRKRAKDPSKTKKLKEQVIFTA
uniref:SURF6 domain-containing protein n=1 Tax=Heterorhabditis bacteriophora TaxID=37862 RepID=A0A1I7XJX7_HETBA